MIWLMIEADGFDIQPDRTGSKKTMILEGMKEK